MEHKKILPNSEKRKAFHAAKFEIILRKRKFNKKEEKYGLQNTKSYAKNVGSEKSVGGSVTLSEKEMGTPGFHIFFSILSTTNYLRLSTTASLRKR